MFLFFFSTLYIYIVNRFTSISVFNSHSLGMQCMYVFFFLFFFLLMVWNYYFISARWLPPLRINKVKVKVKVIYNTGAKIFVHHI